MSVVLSVENLRVRVGGKEVLSGVSLDIRAGEIHFLMGPNGSGKSSLAYAIAGHPEYQVTTGSITLGGQHILTLKPEERASRGLFLSFQEPPEVGGVSMSIFLKSIATGETPHVVGERVAAFLPRIGLQEQFMSRLLNEGFSGGEKKKSELLQMIARKPKIAILDEIDSGLDVDALKSVAQIISDSRKSGTGFLIITHAPRLISYLEPDQMHILIGGRCVASGGKEILAPLEERGYEAFTDLVKL